MADTFAVLHIDMVDLQVNTLIAEDEEILRPIAWEVMETIWLNVGEGNLWWMDAESKALTLVVSEARAISYSR